MVSQKVLPVSWTLKWPSPMAPESQKHNSKKFWDHQNGVPLYHKRNAFPRQKLNSCIHLWLSAPQQGRMAKNNSVTSFFIHLKWYIIGLLAMQSHNQPPGQVKQRHSNYGIQGHQQGFASLDPGIYLAFCFHPALQRTRIWSITHSWKAESNWALTKQPEHMAIAYVQCSQCNISIVNYL